MIKKLSLTAGAHPERLRTFQYTLARVWKTLPLGPRRRIMWLLQPTFTVGASAIVLDDRDEVLLLRHRFRESQSWQFPGGFLERGETIEAAIAREIREETGFDVEVLGQLATEVKYPLHVDVLMLARIVGGSLKVESQEVLEAGFVPLAQTGLAQSLSADNLNQLEVTLSRIRSEGMKTDREPG